MKRRAADAIYHHVMRTQWLIIRGSWEGGGYGVASLHSGHSARSLNLAKINSLGGHCAATDTVPSKAEPFISYLMPSCSLVIFQKCPHDYILLYMVITDCTNKWMLYKP